VAVVEKLGRRRRAPSSVTLIDAFASAVARYDVRHGGFVCCPYRRRRRAGCDGFLGHGGRFEPLRTFPAKICRDEPRGSSCRRRDRRR